MMQSHFREQVLKKSDYGDVRVLFATNPSDRAVVLIHGYGGDAVSTWSQFEWFIRTRSDFGATDVYFYGYDGLYAELAASAAIFREFLADMFSGTLVHENLPSGVQRPNDFRYASLVVVAHSLGAVVTRWALLEAKKSHSSWANHVQFILFAPAHRGAQLSKLVLEAVDSVGILRFFTKPLVGIVSPLVDQLKPDSDELKWLRNETLKGLRQGHGNLTAQRVVVAQYDKVVKNLPFCEDPPPTPARGQSHTSVCKPKADYLLPIVIVFEIL